MPSAKALRSGEEFDGLEFVAKPVRGAPPIHLVVSGRPLRDDNDATTGAALIYRDITASRETEHKLQQAQKLDAIGKLTGGVAHDFNNMLTVITGTTETLVDSLRAEPQLAKTAEADRPRRRALPRADPASARLRPPPAAGAAHRRHQRHRGSTSPKLLRPTLGEQIEINSVLAPDVASVHIDPSQLANSLLNLAINARDAMPNGGKLLFETSNILLDDAYAAANPDIAPGRYVLLAVSDTGTGMSQRGAGQGVRAVLHHQGGRQGLRPRHEHGLRLRQAVRRPHQDLQRAGPRHHDQALSAPARGQVEVDGAGAGAGAARQRGHPGGRGRRNWCATTSSPSSPISATRPSPSPMPARRAGAGRQRARSSTCCSPT